MTIHQILTTEPTRAPRPSLGLSFVDVFVFPTRSYNVVRIGRVRIGFYTYHYRWTIARPSVWTVKGGI